MARSQENILAMARGPRQAPGGFVYHVLNRAVARLPSVEKPADYAAFLRVLTEALAECPMRILCFVLMPTARQPRPTSRALALVQSLAADPWRRCAGPIPWSLAVAPAERLGGARQRPPN